MFFCYHFFQPLDVAANSCDYPHIMSGGIFALLIRSTLRRFAFTVTFVCVRRGHHFPPILGTWNVKFNFIDRFVIACHSCESPASRLHCLLLFCNLTVYAHFHASRILQHSHHPLFLWNFPTHKKGKLRHPWNSLASSEQKKNAYVGWAMPEKAWKIATPASARRDSTSSAGGRAIKP